MYSNIVINNNRNLRLCTRKHSVKEQTHYSRHRYSRRTYGANSAGERSRRTKFSPKTPRCSNKRFQYSNKNPDTEHGASGFLFEKTAAAVFNNLYYDAERRDIESPVCISIRSVRFENLLKTDRMETPFKRQRLQTHTAYSLNVLSERTHLCSRTF